MNHVCGPQLEASYRVTFGANANSVPRLFLLVSMDTKYVTGAGVLGSNWLKVGDVEALQVTLWTSVSSLDLRFNLSAYLPY